MKEEIKKIIEKAVKKMGITDMPDFSVETPKEKLHEIIQLTWRWFYQSS